MAHSVSRRAFLGTALAAGTALYTGRTAAQQRPPNVLFLFTDDQRHDTLSALGNTEIRTPHMDRIERAGVNFTHCYIQGSTVPAVCVCSRSMLMTGRHLYHSPNTIPGDYPDLLMPEVFRKAGYRTFGTGKWHSGKASYARCFTDGGAIFFGGMHHPDAGGHEDPVVYDFDPEGAYPKEAEKRPHVYSSELFADAAVDFLESVKEDEPFFSYVSFTAPHDPRTPPEPFASQYDPSQITLPKNFMAEHPFDNGELKIRDEMLAGFPRTEHEVKEHIAAYYAMIAHTDHCIGRILNALEKTGQADNTIIVFSGDNGLAVGQHGLLGKQNMYDHSMRVPLIVRVPGVDARRDDCLVNLHDLMPTLCDLAGLETPAACESVSLAPRIHGSREHPHDSVFGAYMDKQRMVCDGRYKLIRYPQVDIAQVFDLHDDPWELTNLVDNQEIVTRLDEELSAWQHRVDDPMLATA